jgi:hypothetical protein
MDDALEIVREVLTDLQAATDSRDPARVHGMFTDDAVLFGTAAANLTWDEVRVISAEPHRITAVGLGRVVEVRQDGETPYPFRLTVIVVPTHAGWRLQHFHGSLPEE